MRVLVMIGAVAITGLAGAQSPASNAVPVAPESNASTPAVVTGAAKSPEEEFALGVQAVQQQQYATAVKSFQAATQARPVFPEAYCNWGIALVQWGRQTPALEQQLQLFQQAAEKFSMAAEQNPQDRLTQLLWAETLVLIGDLPVDGRVRLGCYQGAVEKCRRAAALAPTDWETYNKWGVILSTKLPEFATEDKVRVQLYKEAATQFAKAAENARFGSEIAPLYANWGGALVRAARVATDPGEKTKLLTEAIERFERSARAKHDAAATYWMWGNAYIERGKLSRLRSDFRDGIDRLNTSVSLDPKDPKVYFSLARAYASQGNNLLAIKNLREVKALDRSGTLLRETQRDGDFAGLAKDPEYMNMLNPAVGRGLPASNPPLPR